MMSMYCNELKIAYIYKCLIKSFNCNELIFILLRNKEGIDNPSNYVSFLRLFEPLESFVTK